MMPGHGGGGGPHGEDELLGNVYDARLIKRLIGLLAPYALYLTLGILVLMMVTGFELVLPYITKEAIDRYITISGKKALSTEAINGTIPLTRDTILVDVARLKDAERAQLAILEKAGKLEKTPYYYFRLDKIAQRPRVDSLLLAKPGLAQVYGNIALIGHAKLKTLDKSELLLLRGRDLRGIYRFGLIFLGLLGVSFVLNFCQMLLIQYVGQNFMHGLRVKIFAKLQRLDMAYFDKNPVGRLVTRATNDVDAVNEAFISVFSSLFRNVLLIAALIVMMLGLSVRLSLAAFTMIPFIVAWTIFFRIRARDIYRKIRVRLARLNAYLQENFSGIRVIKIFRREDENIRRFGAINDEYFAASLQEVLVMSFFRPLVEIISAVGLALIIYYGGGSVIASAISLGVLVAFVTYLRMFFHPIQELTESYTVLQQAMASSERIFQLLDEPERIASPPRRERPAALSQTKGKIEFRNVRFEYLPDEPVLKDVSFTVEPGEKVAFVGATGSGKTTIISLIARLYDIQKGEILLDGVDIRKLNLSELRSRLGVVMQDVFLFAGDVKGNIKLNKDLSDEQVRLIAKQVHADTVIGRFPNGYDEEVKERGVTLSAGERQLLSFARALAFDPPILVLDEATANVDSGTEKLIQDALGTLMKGRTSMVIAHRLSTIKSVDRIYVIHKGEIREVGSHQELLSKEGLYYRLYQLQQGVHSTV
ncbi:MAG: ABC transporter ATP-binding protein [Candidatus Edwardsbacteria bacterium]|nr:ABC transporter ATP-binding protein [Candidatus Edwardsbacteria bacterium]